MSETVRLATDHQSECEQNAKIAVMVASATRPIERRRMLEEIASAGEVRVSANAIASATRDL